MKYMGSKRRIAKHIAPIIQGFIDSGGYKTYIEPFVGGANMIEHIICADKQGSDLNQYVIALLIEMQDGDVDFPYIPKEEYAEYKSNPHKYPLSLIGWAGVCCSYNGVWFSGFAGKIITKEGKRRNYQSEAGRHIRRQSLNLRDVDFRCCSYKNWAPKNCVVYCDPPYQDTAGYKDDFSHANFWKWCKKYAESQYGNVVLVSEYNAPEGIECIWQKEINSSLTKDTGSKKGVEKLFLVK